VRRLTCFCDLAANGFRIRLIAIARDYTRVEIAIGALCLAERHLNVDSERHGPAKNVSHKRTSRTGRDVGAMTRCSQRKSQRTPPRLTTFARDDGPRRVVEKVSHFVGTAFLCFQRVTRKIKCDGVPLLFGGEWLVAGQRDPLVQSLLARIVVFSCQRAIRP